MAAERNENVVYYCSRWNSYRYRNFDVSRWSAPRPVVATAGAGDGYITGVVRLVVNFDGGGGPEATPSRRNRRGRSVHTYVRYTLYTYVVQGDYFIRFSDYYGGFRVNLIHSFFFSPTLCFSFISTWLPYYTLLPCRTVHSKLTGTLFFNFERPLPPRLFNADSQKRLCL